MGESKRRRALALVVERDDPRADAQRFCRRLIQEFVDGPEVLIKSSYERAGSALGLPAADEIIRSTREIFEDVAMRVWTKKMWTGRLTVDHHAKLCAAYKEPAGQGSMMARMASGVDMKEVDLEAFGAKVWPDFIRGTWRDGMANFCRKKISGIKPGEQGQELMGLFWLVCVARPAQQDRDELVLEYLKTAGRRPGAKP
jgi:hypothetical protein